MSLAAKKLRKAHAAQFTEDGLPRVSLWLHRNDLLAAIKRFYPEDTDERR